MANSNDRKSLILFDPNAKTEHYERSKHNDFATSSELKERKFGGWRINKLTDTMELWIEGEVVRTVTAAQLLADPDAVNKAYKDFFQLD